jgi:WD40 repeat protein
MRAVADAMPQSTGDVVSDVAPLISRFAGRLVTTVDCGAQPVREIIWPDVDQFGALSGGELTTWDVSSGALIRRLGLDLRAMVCSSDGTLIAGHPRSSDGSDTSVAVADIASGREIHKFESDKSIFNWCWHPREKLLATAGFDAIIWSVDRGEIVHRLDSEIQEGAYSIAWSPDGTLVASGHWWPHGRVLIWDLESENELAQVLPKESEKERSTLVSWLAWRESMSALFVGVHSAPHLAPVEYDRIEVWNPVTLEYHANLNAGTRPDTRFSIGEKRQLLAQIRGESVAISNFYQHRQSSDVGECDGEIVVGPVNTQAICVAWAPGCDCLATGYSDGSVRIWA